MPHTLVAGGTGMLKGVSLYLASHGNTVSVISRDPLKSENLILEKGESGFINPVRVDYREYDELTKKLRNAINNYGAIETAVCWIHSDAPEAPHLIAEIINEENIPVRFFHVLGCEYSVKNALLEDYEQTFARYKNILYRKIILGFVIEEDRSRWLTNTEISNGVIDAVAKDLKSFVVGTVQPYNKRPML